MPVQTSRLIQVAVLVAGCLGVSLPAAAQEQFHWVVQTNTHADALAAGAISNPPDDAAVAAAAAHGVEQNQCNSRELRQSNGASTAQARKDVETETTIGVTLAASAHANGGHFNRCASCPFGTCVGTLPEDTAASASARASASVNLVFDADARRIWYTLAINREVHGSAADLAFHVTDADNHDLAYPSKATTIIEGGPGKSYHISALIVQNAQNSGACCTDDKSGDSSFLVTVTRAPIIASEREFNNVETANKGRIIGGRPETGFPLVGALFLNGAIHCTGTVIGPNTVLTAAHCVFQQKPAALKWIEGPNSQVATTALEITGIDYPQESDGSYRYDDKNLTDDIAVVYLKASSHTAGMPQYAGLPAMDTILSDKLLITFMGYGFQRVQGELIGAGIKRRVEMPLAGVSPRTFEYRTPDKNTCYGDSGGPAFVATSTTIYVIGVTSQGDARCAINGIDTRVDAFAPWLRTRIK